MSFYGSRLEAQTVNSCLLNSTYALLTSRSAEAATGQLVKAPGCDQLQVIFLYDYVLRSGPLRAAVEESSVLDPERLLA
jgi:hypothetical protein